MGRIAWGEAIAGIIDTPAMTVPIPLAAGTSILFQGSCVFLGESALGGATAGRATFYDGLDATGNPVFVDTFSATALSQHWFGSPGVLCQQGLTVATAQALTIGMAWVVPLWRPGVG